MSIRGKPPRAMWERLFRLSAERAAPLQAQIRQMLAVAVAERALLPGDPVPSSRELSEVLGVARNTVVLAYQQLVDEGLLVSRERSGYFVSPELGKGFMHMTEGWLLFLVSLVCIGAIAWLGSMVERRLLRTTHE